MNVPKVCTIVGARPQFIKMASVSVELRKGFDEIVIHTGQHYDKEMSEVFFNDLRIPEPDYNLKVGSGSHAEQTALILKKVEKILINEKPDMVLLYGDTNSTLAGALASSKVNIPITHIEAGLRSFNRAMPEEINRILTDHCSSLLFTPTEAGVVNLKNEGITDNVYNVGDVMYDSILQNIKKAESRKSIMKKIILENKEFIFATVHRPSNTDSKNNLKSIVKAFILLDVKVVIALHPRTRKKLISYNLLEKLEEDKNTILLEPLGYLDTLLAIKNASFVLTDSGGIQKESYILKTPCITLREDTEWIETLNFNCNVLVGNNCQKIVNAVNRDKLPNRWKQYYGDGKASKKISQIIWNYLKE